MGVAPRWWWLAAGALVAACTALAYADAASYGFLFGDDQRNVRDNPYLHRLTAESLRWMFAASETDYWRPLSFFSHALDYAIWGDRIGGHHVTSIALHAANAVLVMAIGATVCAILAGERRGTGPALACGTVAGLLFALHPQHVETTVWISERKGVLAAFFYLAAVWSYLLRRGRPDRGRYVTLALGLMAMLSKPIAVSLPVVLLMLDVYPLRRLRPGRPWRDWLRLVGEKTSYALFACAVSVFTYFAVDTGGYINDTDLLGGPERAINAARSVWLYFGRWLAPVGLVPLYPMVLADNSVSAVNLLPAAALVLAVALGIARWRLGNGMLAGVAGIHLALLLPVLGIVHTGLQSSADRYAYLPGAWMSVAAGALAVAAWTRWRASPATRRIGAFALVAWLAGLGLLTERQVLVWKDDRVLGRTITRYYPGWHPHYHYAEGVKAFRAGDFTRAVRLFEAAVAYGQFVPRARVHLALALEALGYPARAERQLRTALRLDPDSPFVLRVAAGLLARLGRADEAREIVARLDAARPGDPSVARQRALVELRAGRPDEAERILSELEATGETDADTRVLLGIAAQLRGDAEAARRHYEAALRLDPGHPDALHNLGRR